MAQEGLSNKRGTPLFYGLALFALISFPIFIHYLPKLLTSQVVAEDLSGDWEACSLQSDADPLSAIQNCSWKSIKFPGTIERQGINPTNWMVYRRKLATPTGCENESGCELIIGTLSDPTRAYLNGKLLGEVGSAPPNSRYAQTYPGSFLIPKDTWTRDNEMLLLQFPLTRKNNGIIRGPIGIFPVRSGVSVLEFLVGETVLLPLMAALILIILGLIGSYTVYLENQALRGLKTYLGYCFVTGTYLISLSRIPREYLPLNVGYPIHFAIRFVSEFFFISLVASVFQYRGIIVRVLRNFYLSIASLLGLSVLVSWIGVQSSFGPLLTFVLWLTNVGATLFLSTSIFGVWLCWSSRESWKSKLLFPLLAAVAFMQLSDILALSGIIEDVYFGRFYPLAIGIVFGFVIWQSGEEKRREAIVTRELGQIAAQVAHDIRSPLAALRVVAKAPELDDASMIILEAVNRLQGISQDLLNQFTGQKKQSHSVNVNSLITRLISEKRVSLPNSINLNAALPDEPLLLTLPESDLGRVIANLIDNAVKAFPNSTGSVTISGRQIGSDIWISVSDDGSGIPPEVLARIKAGERVTSGGHGLGITYVRSQIEKWNAHIEIESQLNQGTIVRLRFPETA